MFKNLNSLTIIGLSIIVLGLLTSAILLATGIIEDAKFWSLIMAIILAGFIIANLEAIKRFKFKGLEIETVRSAETSPLPKDSVKLEEKSGVPLEFYDYFNQGNSFLHQGEIKNAREFLEKALRVAPDNYETLVSLGLACNILKDNGKSIEYSKAALKVRPNAFIPQFNLAVATNHLLGSKKSIEEYLKAEEVAKKAEIGESVIVGKLNLFVGHDYLALEDREEAMKRYLKAKEILSMYNTVEAIFWLKNVNENIRKLEKNGKE